MKKVISIILFFCLIAPFFGHYAWLQYKKQGIRKEVKWKMIAGIDKSELVYFKFSKQETETTLRWKHSREFVYNGQMYDVVESEIQGDSIAYWAWWDDEETQLNQQLKQLIADTAGNSTQSKQQQKEYFKFFKSLFHENVLQSVIAIASRAEIQYINYGSTPYLIVYLYPPSPPPERV